jgi:hypothetical protein
MMELTSTRQREIVKALRIKFDAAGYLTMADIRKVSQVKSLAIQKIIAVATEKGFTIKAEEPKVKAPKKEPHTVDVDIKAVSDKVLAAILRASIFKLLAPTDDGKAPPDDAIVITTYGLLRKEREALAKIILGKELTLARLNDFLNSIATE